MKNLILYARVSTQEQGKTKNGLEAQTEAMLRFANENGYRVVEVLQEIASGTLDLGDRPVLAGAVARAAKARDTYIVVNKLDRLSRDVLFILNLRQANPRLIVTEFGEDVDPMMFHLYAMIAEKERAMISQRTRAALQAKKARGEVLGASKDILEKASANSRMAVQSLADAFAQRLKPTIQRMLDAGMSYRQVAEELNSNGTKTARGGSWYASTVSNLVARIA